MRNFPKIALYTVSVTFLFGLVFVDFHRITENKDGVVDGAISALIVTFLIAILFEVVLRREGDIKFRNIEKAIEQIPARVNERFRDASMIGASAKELFWHHVTNIVGQNESATSFIDTITDICHDKRFLVDATIKITLSSMIKEDKSSYRLTLEENFTTSAFDGPFLVAISGSPSTVMKIANYAKAIDKVYAPTTLRTIKRLPDVSKILRLEYGEVGAQTRSMKLSDPSIVPESEAVRLLAESGLTDSEQKEVIILSFGINTKNRVHIRVIYKEIDKISTGYCYWTPDRPTYVNRLEFDYASLENYIHSVKGIEFFMCPIAKIIDEDAVGKRHLRIDGWLLPGHGAALLWSEKL